MELTAVELVHLVVLLGGLIAAIGVGVQDAADATVLAHDHDMVNVDKEGRGHTGEDVAVWGRSVCDVLRVHTRGGSGPRGRARDHDLPVVVGNLEGESHCACGLGLTGVKRLKIAVAAQNLDDALVGAKTTRSKGRAGPF